MEYILLLILLHSSTGQLDINQVVVLCYVNHVNALSTFDLDSAERMVFLGGHPAK